LDREDRTKMISALGRAGVPAASMSAWRLEPGMSDSERFFALHSPPPEMRTAMRLGDMSSGYRWVE
jgi:hypothetical protein